MRVKDVDSRVGSVGEEFATQAWNSKFESPELCKLYVVAHVCNSSTFVGRWEMETESLDAQQPSSLVYSGKENETKPRAPFSKMEGENH